MAATVQVPFLTLCDAGMATTSPAACTSSRPRTSSKSCATDLCMSVRLRRGRASSKLAHILLLLATHHILRGGRAGRLCRRPHQFAHRLRRASARARCKPRNQIRLRRRRRRERGRCVRGVVVLGHSMHAWICSAVLHGFDWASSRGSLVVDVGGGIGSTSMSLASVYAEVDTDGSGGLRS
ncbi:hypothetical protein B0H14DRAFT_2514875 [Mycena olivaceomarginata]|nr:hypothetical protein B0H14DRAFT_2514875 [Mycena olivaceomarginata]